jgi:predicted metal-dependent phosphoesterase TrpH
VIVDFHVHSTASDGTKSPADLAVDASGFTAIALTDHDNCDGIEEFLHARGSGDRRLFPGIELSIEPGKGFDKFHLLGLGIDYKDEELRLFLKRVLEGRNERNARILANFRRLGIEIPPEDIARYANGEVLARPHFAQWLVVNGVAENLKIAFDKFLLPDSPKETRCYEERWHPSQEDAFSIIHRAGGICVMAHPRYWCNSWRHVGCDFASAKRELAVLKEKGLDGLEAFYEANLPAENVEFTRLASELGLLKSAGSDFHGANKPAIALGMEVSESFIAPLLERLDCA